MHSCENVELAWMVRFGRLLHRARGLTRFLEGALFGATKDKYGILRSAQNDNFEASYEAPTFSRKRMTDSMPSSKFLM